ncbi:MAG: Mov34/MPN/PAD-1 family protein [Phycisphaeraceae bacterium]|nr:Mov34/MPN/PAD-1 family protein [Phycisphaeraceae bacterium]
MSDVTISVNFLRWRRLMLELKRRGGGRRESGAFLLGLRDGQSLRVKDVVYYDDLDPNALDQGYVNFHADGFSALWSHCRKARLDVLADIHTHPGGNTSQSELDRTNPMMAERGHLALIVPHFAAGPWWSKRGISLFEYEANYRWKDLSGALPSRLCLTVF